MSAAASKAVPARTVLHIGEQPTSFNVSANDVMRGYTDLPDALRFSVASNCCAGYNIELQSMSDHFDAVLMTGLGVAVQVDRLGISIAQRGATSQKIRHVLGFRVLLKSWITTGHYAWPLMLTVRPRYQ